MVDLSLIKPSILWYVVGFITTDGNLSPNGRHINITSKDRRLLLKIRLGLNLKNKIGIKSNGVSSKKVYSVLQFGDVKFYKFLQSIGLTPRKSLTIGRLDVPDSYFPDFLRGVIDGDGSIENWIHRTNKNIQWSLRVVSGSMRFVEWLKERAEEKFNVRGRLHVCRPKNKNPLYQVKFGKFAAKVILGICYYKNCLALPRKLQIAKKCINSENKLSKYGNVIILKQ